MADQYIPGEMSRRYQRLSNAERSTINIEVDSQFYRKYPTAPKNLNWSTKADRPLAREWLRIRDQVMTERFGARASLGSGAEIVRSVASMSFIKPELYSFSVPEVDHAGDPGPTTLRQLILGQDIYRFANFLEAGIVVDNGRIIKSGTKSASGMYINRRGSFLGLSIQA